MTKLDLILKVMETVEDSSDSNLRVNLLKALQEELKQVEEPEEEPQEEQGITKEDILKIKDSKKRIQAINKNRHLF